MICSNCQAENPDAATFCMSCGTRMRACASCGTELPAGAAFCINCGHQVGTPVAASAGASVAAAEPPAAAPEDPRLRRYIPPELLVKLEQAGGLQAERRRVTMLFCDVTGSTSAAQHLDPEEWAEIMNGAFEHLIAPIYRYEGTLARLMGDAVLAFFGAPITHEDDPERAVRAGLDILEEIEPYREEVRRRWDFDFNVRIGINTGLVVVGAVGSDLRVEYTAMGDAVNIAARMEQTADPGTVQISGETHQFVERLFEFQDLGPVDVRGRDQRVQGFRVLRALERPATTRGIEGLRPTLIGRDEELATLEAATDAVLGGQGRIVTLQGEAGLGKSRLVTELRDHLEDGRLARLRWCEGRALSYETTTPYAPVRELMRALSGIGAEHTPGERWERLSEVVREALPARAAMVAPYLGVLIDAELPAEHNDRIAYLDPPHLRGEIFRAAAELIEALTRQRPLVLVLEDLHWADSASVDLIEELLSLCARSALLLLLVFRPNRDDASWRLHETAEREYPHVYEVVRLTPLETDETRALVASLLAVDGLSESVRNLIVDKAEGNPYFVEEVVRSLIDRGAVRRDDGRWIATEEVSVLDVPDTLSAVLTTRLDRLGERARAVTQAASVIGREFRYDELVAVLGDERGLDEVLLELQRREFAREVARIPRRVFRFKHVLVQEAAYETVLLRRRVELHAAVASFLERLQPERVEDIADHLLRAREPERALPFLVSAGERAARAYTLPEAIARLERALELMDEGTDGALMRRALEALGSARDLRFDFDGARHAYERLVEEGVRRGDQAMRISGLNKASLLRGLLFDERLAALDDLASSEEMARASSDGAGLLESCMAQCYLHTGNAEFEDVEYYMNEVSRLGRELGAEEPTLFGMVHLANTLVYLTRFDEALKQAEAALVEAERQGHAKFQAELLTLSLPLCHLRRGDFASAMAVLERGMEIALRIGDRESEVLAATFQGKAAMLQGAYEDALSLFRRASDAADATRLPHFQALGRCVTGTCYSEIGGPLIERALQHHGEALALMDEPMGKFLGAWLWSEMAMCALAAGEAAAARGLLERALTEPTAVMHLMRPLALEGMTHLALVEGRTEDARGYFDECEQYVREREMRDHYPVLALLGGRVLAAEGEHAQALARFDEAIEVATASGMRRLLLDAHACKARSFDALARATEAAEERAAARRLLEEISSGFRDDDLRRGFVAGAVALLEPVG